MLQLLLAGGVMVYSGKKLYQHLRRKEMPSLRVGQKIIDHDHSILPPKEDRQATTELLLMEKSEIGEK